MNHEDDDEVDYDDDVDCANWDSHECLREESQFATSDPYLDR